MKQFRDKVKAQLRAVWPAGYIYNLAKQFSAFYHQRPVLQAESQELREARLVLLRSVKQVIENCFELLGIPAVEGM